jgi:hypothetical protein
MKNSLHITIAFAFIFYTGGVSGQAIVTKSDSIALKRDTVVNLILQKHRGLVQWQILSGGTTWENIAGKTKDTLSVNTGQAAKYKAKITEGTCLPIYSDPVSIVFIIPSVTTDSVTNITQISATGGGKVTADGGTPVNSRGVCWNTTGNPTIHDSKTSDGSGTGSFVSLFTGLTQNTKYYVRAYATNNAGTAYGNQVVFKTPSIFSCGSPLTIIHIAGSISPVSKTVSYGTITDIPGEPLKCWITKNLGADRQATAVDDSTEASAGWYWQFNRKQGYKQDGTTRTPNSFWDANINEELDWQVVNDPCAIELGDGWHVPTLTEWTNVNGASGGNWTTWNGPWNSGLKLHAAGLLRYTDGTSYLRGFSGHYLSSTRYSMMSDWLLEIANDRSRIAGGRKSYGYSIRCILDCLSAPKEPTPGIHIPSQTRIIWKWTKVTGATGYKGNFTDNYGTAIDLGTDTTYIDTGLTCGTTYKRYLWAYNGCGSSKPVTVTQATLPCSTCGTTITINHVAGAVAPVSKTVTYGTVTNIPGETSKCWITSNLGADRQATAVEDATEASAGWYWQFNRKQGYKHDGTSVTPAWTVNSVDENSNWTSSNDPCSSELGTGWHIPTYTEWFNVDGVNGGNWTNKTGPWNSQLKLHAAGCLFVTNGSIVYRGSYGYYWSNSQSSNAVGWSLSFDSAGSSMYLMTKATGVPLRCVK